MGGVLTALTFLSCFLDISMLRIKHDQLKKLTLVGVNGCGLSSLGRQTMLSVMEVQREGVVGTGGLRRAQDSSSILYSNLEEESALDG